MKKKLKCITIMALSFLFVSIPNVFASSEIKSRDYIQIDGKAVKRCYNNTATGKLNCSSDSLGVGKITLVIDGKEVPGFCIDFGMPVEIGTSETPESLKTYFQNVLTESESEELIKKLIRYTTFGYGKEGRNSDRYYLATQQLIWQAISDTGFYESDFYYNRVKDYQAKTRIEDFKWIVGDETNILDISNEINSILNSINNYYKTPSFCSSQNKIEIEVGESAQFTDNNNVLSLYEVKCDTGISCETNGNKLKVTALDEASSQRITFSKAPSGTENLVYRVPGKQGIITNQGALEPISCEFGIDSFKNVQTSDAKILYVITIGLFCGIMAYIAYYTKKSLDGLK